MVGGGGDRNGGGEVIVAAGAAGAVGGGEVITAGAGAAVAGGRTWLGALPASSRSRQLSGGKGGVGTARELAAIASGAVGAADGAVAGGEAVVDVGRR